MKQEAHGILTEARQSRQNYQITGSDFDRVKANMYSIFECYAHGLITWDQVKTRFQKSIREYVSLYKGTEHLKEEINFMRQEYKTVLRNYKPALDEYRKVAEQKLTKRILDRVEFIGESAAQKQSSTYYNNRVLSESVLADTTRLTWKRVMEAYPNLTAKDEARVRMLTIFEGPTIDTTQMITSVMNEEPTHISGPMQTSMRPKLRPNSNIGSIEQRPGEPVDGSTRGFDTEYDWFNPRAGHMDQPDHPQNRGLAPSSLAPKTSPRPKMRPKNLGQRAAIDAAVRQAMGEGWEELPPIDRKRYGNRENEGLEGPIMTRSGKVVYYDTKEGAYYDPDTDMYISYDDWRMLDKKGMHMVGKVDEARRSSYEVFRSAQAKERNKKYTPPTQAEIDADRKKDEKGKPRPSMSTKSINKKMYEALTLDYSRYMRSHGKKPRPGSGVWMFTTTDMGEPAEDDVFQFSGNLADAKRAAAKWAKGKGAYRFYVMEKEEKNASGFDARTIKALADLKVDYPHAPDTLSAILRALEDVKRASKREDHIHSSDIGKLEDRVNKIEKDHASMETEATRDEENEFHAKLDRLVHKTFGKRKEEMNEAKLSSEQRKRLDDLMRYLYMVTGPEYWPDDDSDDLGPTEILNIIRKEFGDKIADQVESGLDNVWHWGRQHHTIGNDYLSWRKNTRVNKSGKANKTDINALKNSMKRDKGAFAKDPKRLPENDVMGKTTVNEASLKVGSRGEDVAALQRALGIPADGIFGPATLAAVKAAQQRLGVSADGIVGPKTMAAMQAAQQAERMPTATSVAPPSEIKATYLDPDNTDSGVPVRNLAYPDRPTDELIHRADQAIKAATPPATVSADPDRPFYQSTARDLGPNDDMSFGQAFKTARDAAGGAGGQFTWRGKQYQTNLANEPYVPASRQKPVLQTRTPESVGDIDERKMTKKEKSKEKRLKKKYDDSGMKASMKKQYGDDWESVYFATIRKKAMEQFNEMTSAGAVATVAQPMGKMIKRKKTNEDDSAANRIHIGHPDDYTDDVWKHEVYIDGKLVAAGDHFELDGKTFDSVDEFIVALSQKFNVPAKFDLYALDDNGENPKLNARNFEPRNFTESKKKSPAGGPACWDGKKIHPTKPTKMKGGKRVNNCIDDGK